MDALNVMDEKVHETDEERTKSLTIKVIEARGLAQMDILPGLSDPYVKVCVGTKVMTTRAMDRTLEPKWGEEFSFVLQYDQILVSIEVWDKDALSQDDFMGVVQFPVGLLDVGQFARWYSLRKNDVTTPTQGEILLEFVIEETPFTPPWKPVIGTSVQSEFLSKCLSKAGFYHAFNDESNEDKTGAPSKSLCPSHIPPVGCEVVEVKLENIAFGISGNLTNGDFYLTNYRMVFIEQEHIEDTVFSQGTSLVGVSDFSMFVPLGSFEYFKIVREKNFIKNSRDSHVYRIKVRCKDFRVFHILCPLSVLTEQLRVCLEARLTYLLANQTHDPITFTFVKDWRAKSISQHAIHVPSSDSESTGEAKLHGWGVLNMDDEMERLEVHENGWRRTAINESYEICETYPSVMYAPQSVSDEILRDSASYRSKGRLPILVWRNTRHGNVMMRAAQPLAGMRKRECEADQLLLEAVREMAPNSSQLLIFDARSQVAAGGNAMKGKGTEDVGGHKWKMYFLNIGNIHVMRNSGSRLHKIVNSTSLQEDAWPSAVVHTQWLTHIMRVLQGATTVALFLEQKRNSCLIHCSDGWDRTPQICSLAQIMLDPYYRTIDGFKVLIEKEWLAFGHKFDERIGYEHPKERSPVFLQFLDCVHQIMHQFPYAFEFTETMLVIIATHITSGWFGNFLLNSQKARIDQRIDRKALSIWAYLDSKKDEITAPVDARNQSEVIIPICSLKVLRLWSSFYLRYDEIFYKQRSSYFLSPENEPRNADHMDDHEGVHIERPKQSEDEQPVLVNQIPQVMWIPDDWSDKCSDCNVTFAFFKRRSHCRACGKLFCRSCVWKKVDLSELGYKSPQKVCESCFNQYSKSPKITNRKVPVLRANTELPNSPVRHGHKKKKVKPERSKSE